MKKPVKHTYHYIQNAVKLATSPNRTITSVAIELGVPSWKLRQWIQEHKEKLERGSDLDELIRLKNENADLREEVEILKKAAA